MFKVLGASCENKPLIAFENFDDLRSIVTPSELIRISSAALSEAGAALVDVRHLPLSDMTADRIHRAAGPVAMIGAIQFHTLLCELEQAIRARQASAVEPALDASDRIMQETLDWFNGAVK